MDALDMQILRELGMEPFVGWAKRPRGLRTAAVADTLGVGLQLVKDRIARMTEAGVITGYRLLPNLRHRGQGITVYHLQDASVPDMHRMSQLADVDGFFRVVWFLDSGLCINLSHGTDIERRRRIQVLARLVSANRPAKILYTIDFPKVARSLDETDWRIIRALEHDAKRPHEEVAKEVGVSSKTLRTRLSQMRREGSIDEYAALDLSKLSGVIPFQLAVWLVGGAVDDVRRRFADRYLAEFTPPAEDGYCSFVLRIFAYTPAEVQAIVREAQDLPGVARAEAQLATGGWDNPQWVNEMLDAQVSPVP